MGIKVSPFRVFQCHRKGNCITIQKKKNIANIDKKNSPGLPNEEIKKGKKKFYYKMGFHYLFHFRPYLNNPRFINTRWIIGDVKEALH